MTAEEILGDCTQSYHPELGMFYETVEVIKVINGAMKVSSIQFALWINTEGWQRYVDEDEWICLSENNNVISTAQLYDKYEKSLVAARPVK